MINFAIGFAAIIAAAACLSFARLYYVRYKHIRQRYRFFALRDKLYLAAIENQVDVNSRAYKFTRDVLNELIQDVRSLDAFEYAKIIKMYKNPSEYKTEDNLVREIKSNKTLKRIHQELFSSAITAMIENSILVKITDIRAQMLYEASKKKPQTRKILSTNMEKVSPALKTYNSLEEQLNRFGRPLAA